MASMNAEVTPEVGLSLTDSPIDLRVEIGEFLRSRRARLSPGDVGLPEFGRYRRVPGLRREELAHLAGVSVAYLTRLEQGKGNNVSPEILDALARALRLTAAEHAYLTHLVKCQRRRRYAEPDQEPVRTALWDMLAAFEGTPAYVMGRRTDIVVWNRMATAVFGDWERLPPPERNWARLLFSRPDYQRLIVDWKAKAADVVAALRLYASCYYDDPRLLALTRELSARSGEFRRLWAKHDVKERGHGPERLRHPLVGELDLSFETFRLAGDSELALVVYHARPGSATAENLRLLASWEADTAERPRRDSEPLDRQT